MRKDKTVVNINKKIFILKIKNSSINKQKQNDIKKMNNVMAID
jgi:hypothetical protein